MTSHDYRKDRKISEGSFPRNIAALRKRSSPLHPPGRLFLGARSGELHHLGHHKRRPMATFWPSNGPKTTGAPKLLDSHGFPMTTKAKGQHGLWNHRFKCPKSPQSRCQRVPVRPGFSKLLEAFGVSQQPSEDEPRWITGAGALRGDPWGEPWPPRHRCQGLLPLVWWEANADHAPWWKQWLKMGIQRWWSLAVENTSSY